jgi:hypothetical protein
MMTNQSKTTNPSNINMLNTNSGEIKHKKTGEDMDAGDGEDGEVKIKEADNEFDSFSPQDQSKQNSHNISEIPPKKEIQTIDYHDNEETRAKINKKVKESMKNINIKTTMTSQEKKRGIDSANSPSSVSYYKKIMNH